MALKIQAARVIYSILFYALSMALIIVSRPKLIFDERSGDPLPFGIGEGKTLFSLGVVTVALALLAFYLFALIDMVFS